jgi:hypothetical protein
MGGSGWLVLVRPSLPADVPRIRRAGPDDVDSWVRTYLDALAATYSMLLPPEFLAQQRARASELVERYRAVFTAQRADPHRSHRAWYAEDAVGPVGIVEVRTGPSGWELDRGLPPPGPRRQLVKLYTLPPRARHRPRTGAARHRHRGRLRLLVDHGGQPAGRSVLPAQPVRPRRAGRRGRTYLVSPRDVPHAPDPTGRSRSALSGRPRRGVGDRARAPGRVVGALAP